MAIKSLDPPSIEQKFAEKVEQADKRKPAFDPQKPRNEGAADQNTSQAKQSSITQKRGGLEVKKQKQTSIHAQAQASTDTRTRAHIYEDIRKAVVRRSRLGGFTFRYQTDELDRLDAVIAKINKDQEIKVSKNDVVRIALNWLLEDYDKNRRASVLANVLVRLRR